MPRYSYDPEEYDELRFFHERYRTMRDPDPGPFPEHEYNRDAEGEYVRYVPATASFKPSDLNGHARVTYDELLALGASVAVGSYDGGGDDVFVRFESIAVEGEELSSKEAQVRLADGPAGDNPALYEDWIRSSEYFERMDRAERAGYGLSALAGWFTDKLGVYGTGSFSVRGTFRADLRGGSIVDVREDS